MKKKFYIIITICILLLTFSLPVSAEENSEYQTRIEWWATINTSSGLIKVPQGAYVPGTSAYYVRLLQCCLNRYGGYGLTTDGICGANTVAAIRKFQGDVSIEVDGVAGYDTWQYMSAIIGANNWKIKF